VRLIVLPNLVTLLIDIVAWGLIHAGTGYAVHRMRITTLAHEHWWSRPRAFERDGRWYRERLRIKQWKDRLPEAGAMFRGGISKRTIPNADNGGLECFVVETRRAELGHGLAAAGGVPFVLWNPPIAALLLVAYGLAVNLPFIAIQRYNRLRATRIMRLRASRRAQNRARA
jgi:glycosyl-4,4'-diaponeurosporenoate acyltransferase